MRYVFLMCQIFTPVLIFGQAVSLPFIESFDTLQPPSLPAGWVTTMNRGGAGDFLSTGGGSLSEPVSVVSVNSTVQQSLTTPLLDLSDHRGCVLRWAHRRSASHDASLVVEGSVDGGASFQPVGGDPFHPTGETGYLITDLPLGDLYDEADSVRIRWTLAGDGSGTAGTIRFDDVSLTGRARLDIAAIAGGTEPSLPRTGDPVEVSCSVRNSGFTAAPGWVLDAYIDHDGDGTPGTGEYHSSLSGNGLPPWDSTGYSITFTPSGPIAGVMFIATLEGDMDASNDTAYVPVRTGPAANAVVINEIMYDPLPGRAEYVELLNVSGREIDMNSWRLSDSVEDTTGGGFGEHVPVLGPGGLAVCSPDTPVARDYPGIPPGTIIIRGLRGITLNNGGDVLVLSDATGFVIDLVEYSPGWHTPVVEETAGRSLERIGPGSAGSEGWNWGTSADASGGTPGRMNSLSVGRSDGDGHTGLSCSPNPFSPDGDGFEDVTRISYRRGKNSALIRVRIYNTDGWLVRTLSAGSYVAGDAAIAWNGFDDEGRKVPIGIYVVFLEGVDGSGRDVFMAKGVVVVAGDL